VKGLRTAGNLAAAPYGNFAAIVSKAKCLSPLAKLDYDCFKNTPKERQGMMPGWEV
jgi:hypothetical protein